MKPASERLVKKDYKMFTHIKLARHVRLLSGSGEENAKLAAENGCELNSIEKELLCSGEVSLILYWDDSFEMIPTEDLWDIYTVAYDA